MKPELDLNFDEITGKTKETPVPYVHTKPAPPHMTGIELFVPTDHPRVWLRRDIGACTGEEFLRWAKSYHPYVTASAEKFNSLANRMQAYEAIKKYHSDLLSDKVRETKN